MYRDEVMNVFFNGEYEKKKENEITLGVNFMLKNEGEGIIFKTFLNFKNEIWSLENELMKKHYSCQYHQNWSKVKFENKDLIEKKLLILLKKNLNEIEKVIKNFPNFKKELKLEGNKWLKEVEPEKEKLTYDGNDFAKPTKWECSIKTNYFVEEFQLELVFIGEKMFSSDIEQRGIAKTSSGEKVILCLSNIKFKEKDFKDKEEEIYEKNKIYLRVQEYIQQIIQKRKIKILFT